VRAKTNVTPREPPSTGQRLGAEELAQLFDVGDRVGGVCKGHFELMAAAT
jgi:hypothetical protein